MLAIPSYGGRDRRCVLALACKGDDQHWRGLGARYIASTVLFAPLTLLFHPATADLYLDIAVTLGVPQAIGDDVHEAAAADMVDRILLVR